MASRYLAEVDYSNLGNLNIEQYTGEGGAEMYRLIRGGQVVRLSWLEFQFIREQVLKAHQKREEKRDAGGGR